MARIPGAKDIILGGVAMLGIGVLASVAFSPKTREYIGLRDRWTCQNGACGRGFGDGWMVHAAHYPQCHNRARHDYDDPASGRILCIECHLNEHLNYYDIGAVKLLARQIWDQGFHTYQYNARHPGAIEQDREMLKAMLERRNLDWEQVIFE